MSSISVLIITYNEEHNIAKCIESIKPLTDKIYIVDSGSEDRTVEISESLGAVTAYRAWTNYPEQINWGIDHFDYTTDWMMRLDADEELTPELVEALKEFLADPPEDVTGVYIRRRVFFLGRWMRHGGYYPTWLMRVWRRGAARCEEVMVDEHLKVDHGRTINIRADLIDKNNKDLTFWTEKHNRYATLEMLNVVQRRDGTDGQAQIEGNLAGQQDNSRRWLKVNLYYRFPPYLRAFLYFSYRYFLRLGFLDGREGLIFHFLQAFWYRFLVDAKIFEHELQARQKAEEPAEPPRPLERTGTSG